MVYAHVDQQSVASVVSDWTGIPVGRMMRDEIETVLKLPEILNRRVVGQSHGLTMIAKRIETSRAKLDNPSKPIGVFMLAGPSGVGKTETALALAETLYGGEQNMITINMSEFQEAHTVSTLKGAPPGYVGYGEGGRLTEAVRRKPYSVILLDEVEKAHPDVHEIFFQVFDKGVMEDGNGRRIDFKNTLIILTTNVGTDLIMGLSRDPKYRNEPEELAKMLRPELLKVFPAALLGRIVSIPYFPLSDEMLAGIVRLQLDRIGRRLRDNHNAAFSYDDAVVEHIVSQLQRSGFRRAHDRQHHHQHPAAGAVARIPQQVACQGGDQAGTGLDRERQVRIFVELSTMNIQTEHRHPTTGPTRIRRGLLPRPCLRAHPPQPSRNDCHRLRHATGSDRALPGAGARLRRRRQSAADGLSISGQRIRRCRPERRDDRARSDKYRHTGPEQHQAPPLRHHECRRKLRTVRLHHRARRVFMGAAGTCARR